jgi:hypothetical protein
MIKYTVLAALLLVGCTKSQFTKEQELYTEVARYACYAAAGQKAADALEAACPDFAKSVSSAISCPAVDLVVDVLTDDLEKCDAGE